MTIWILTQELVYRATFETSSPFLWLVITFSFDARKIKQAAWIPISDLVYFLHSLKVHRKGHLIFSSLALVTHP